jgi:UDP-N-acetylmuramoylalanine--D-glutamate ligase
LSRLRAADVELVSDIELFVAAAEAEFIAVTGSNGKSTVTTLIAAMCDAAGRPSLAGGNLGHAALDLLPLPKPEIYVLELSSFQLQRTSDLPASVSVLLNISPDHLDWHRDMDEYREAKYRVFGEANAAVYNRDDAEAKRRLRPGLPSVSFGLDEPGAGEFGIRLIDDERWLAYGDTLLIRADQMRLVGRHNQANALASLAACHLLGLDLSRCAAVLSEFAGLPHRMQFVRDIAGVRYINDSKATNVGAAIASVQSIDDGVVLLAGGQGKGGDFASFAEAVADRLKALIVFGEDAELIARAFADQADIRNVGTLAEAVDTACGMATSGDTVLLAPACASFDQFDNFNARGDAFVSLVEGLSS